MDLYWKRLARLVQRKENQQKFTKKYILIFIHLPLRFGRMFYYLKVIVFENTAHAFHEILNKATL